MGSKKSQKDNQVDSKRIYESCIKGKAEGWIEASRYVYRVISWKGFGLGHHEKEDLTQETLTYFISGGIERVKEPKAFKKLLRLKAGGCVIDRKRKKRCMQSVSMDSCANDNDDKPAGLQVADPEPGADRAVSSKQSLTLCREIVYSMKEEQCKKLLPTYFKYKLMGEKIGRIAKEMKEPVNTVASRIHRCLKILSKHPQMARLRVAIQESR